VDWWHVPEEEVIESALRTHSARLHRHDPPKFLGGNVVLLTGTTTDGRSFRIEVTFRMSGLTLKSDAKTHVEGAVSLGPVPDALLKVEKAAAKLLEVFAELGVESSIGHFANTMKMGVQPKIDAWRSGAPIDKVALRSSLRDAEQRLKTLTFKDRSDALKIPAGETLNLSRLADETRKACGAASRNVK
jgi:hypothetical protein